MTGLALAIERKRWDVVWLYLMVGVAEAASRLPPESFDELLALLAGEEPPDRRRPRHGA